MAFLFGTDNYNTSYDFGMENTVKALLPIALIVAGLSVMDKHKGVGIAVAGTGVVILAAPLVLTGVFLYKLSNRV